MCAQWIEALKDQTTVVTEQFVHAEHPQEKDRVVVISLNPLALAPRASHRTILATILNFGVLECGGRTPKKTHRR